MAVAGTAPRRSRGSARAMQLPLLDLPQFSPRYRIRQQGLVLRPDPGGMLAWSWARWSFIPPGAREPPAFPLNNARSDKLGSWPWKALQRRRCLVPTSSLGAAEAARTQGSAPRSHYSIQEGRPFLMAAGGRTYPILPLARLPTASRSSSPTPTPPSVSTTACR